MGANLEAHTHVCEDKQRSTHIEGLLHLSISFRLLPGELVIEAWKQLKLIKEYEQRKKLEMIGAMVFNSAGGGTGQSGYHVQICFHIVI